MNGRSDGSRPELIEAGAMVVDGRHAAVTAMTTAATRGRARENGNAGVSSGWGRRIERVNNTPSPRAMASGAVNHASTVRGHALRRLEIRGGVHVEEEALRIPEATDLV